MIETSEMMKVAVEAAKGAGEIHKKYFGKRLDEKGKSEGYLDFVTKTDFESEEFIRSKITEKFPDHNIVGEEEGDSNKESDYEWAIDPLDGTNNYVFGIPYFCSITSVRYKGDVVIGVIYITSVDKLYTAEKGKGAFVNGERINVSKTERLSDSVIEISFGKKWLKEINKLEQTANIMKEISLCAKDVRKMAVAGNALTNVADGTFDAYFIPTKLTPWDTPAGELIIEEAGGKITDIFGDKVKKGSLGLIASNGLIHDELLKLIKKEWE